MKSRRRKIKRSRTKKFRAGSNESMTLSLPLHIENDLLTNHIYKILINPVSELVSDYGDDIEWYIEAEFIEYTDRGLRLHMIVHKTNIPSVSVSSHIVLDRSDILDRPSDITPAESTPRQHYVNTYFNKDIYLNARTLFQVSIHKDQLDHYTQITSETRIECFYSNSFCIRITRHRRSKKGCRHIKNNDKRNPLS